MSNRFKRGLFNKLSVKEEKLKKKLEVEEENNNITHEKLERAKELRSNLEEETLDSDNKFEKYRRRVENL